MTKEEMLTELQNLNLYERAGKYIYERTGQEMPFVYIEYLNRYPNCSQEQLLDPKVVKEMDDLLKWYTSEYGENLSEEQYLEEGKNVEVQRLLRYVDIPRHTHSFFEAIFPLYGSCVHQYGDRTETLSPGDIVIIPPGFRHELHENPDGICITIKIRQSTLLNAFSAVMQENSLLSSYFMQNLELPFSRSALMIHAGKDSFVEETLLTAFAQQETGALYSDSIIESLLSVLFLYLVQNYQDSVEFLWGDREEDHRLSAILQYIFENYQSITLKETASHFSMSVPYLSALIHKLSGQTFSELIRDYRLTMAAEMLAGSRQNLDYISDAVGYRDTSQFIKAFREKYGETPANYRKHCAG